MIGPRHVPCCLQQPGYLPCVATPPGRPIKRTCITCGRRWLATVAPSDRMTERCGGADVLRVEWTPEPPKGNQP